MYISKELDDKVLEIFWGFRSGSAAQWVEPWAVNACPHVFEVRERTGESAFYLA